MSVPEEKNEKMAENGHRDYNVDTVIDSFDVASVFLYSIQ
jgi:hypothetical protein